MFTVWALCLTFSLIGFKRVLNILNSHKIDGIEKLFKIICANRIHEQFLQTCKMNIQMYFKLNSIRRSLVMC